MAKGLTIFKAFSGVGSIAAVGAGAVVAVKSGIFHKKETDKTATPQLSSLMSNSLEGEKLAQPAESLDTGEFASGNLFGGFTDPNFLTNLQASNLLGNPGAGGPLDMSGFDMPSSSGHQPSPLSDDLDSGLSDDPAPSSDLTSNFPSVSPSEEVPTVAGEEPTTDAPQQTKVTGEEEISSDVVASPQEPTQPLPPTSADVDSNTPAAPASVGGGETEVGETVDAPTGGGSDESVPNADQSELTVEGDDNGAASESGGDGGTTPPGGASVAGTGDAPEAEDGDGGGGAALPNGDVSGSGGDQSTTQTSDSSTGTQPVESVSDDSETSVTGNTGNAEDAEVTQLFSSLTQSLSDEGTPAVTIEFLTSFSEVLEELTKDSTLSSSQP